MARLKYGRRWVILDHMARLTTTSRTGGRDGGSQRQSVATGYLLTSAFDPVDKCVEPAIHTLSLFLPRARSRSLSFPVPSWLSSGNPLHSGCPTLVDVVYLSRCHNPSH